jgi:hypothetical protein
MQRCYRCLIPAFVMLALAVGSYAPISRLFAQSDDPGIVSITIDDYQMDILSIRSIDEADGDTPEHGLFLVFEVVLWNHGQDEFTYYGDDFPARVDDTDLKIDHMRAVRDAFYDGIDYPGYTNGQPIDAQDSERSLLIYDVPEDVAFITLEFNPSDSSAQVTLWLEAQDDDYYLFGIDAIERGEAEFVTYTPTPTATVTPTPTITLTPTNTRTPTTTPHPTRTSIPSNTPAPTRPPQTRYVTAQVLNVRECVGTGCDIIGQLEYGDSLLVLDENEDTDGRIWYGFRAFGTTGWVASWLTSASEPAPVVVQPAQPPSGGQPDSPPPAATTAPDATPSWNCGGDIYNCSDFSTCSEVMNYFLACPGDPSKLDQNNNGVPCESLCG